MKKKLLAGLAIGLFMIGITGMSEATILTFDDIPGTSQNTYGYIAGSYGGFDFAGNSYLAYPLWVDTVGMHSYNQGSISGDFTMYSYGVTTITSSTNKDFTFDGLYARDWYSSRGSLDIEGYNNGSLVWNSNFTLNSNWDYVVGSSIMLDELRLIGTSNYSNNNFLVDNLALNETAPVPEPSTMLLFGTGLVGLVVSRIRRKKKIIV